MVRAAKLCNHAGGASTKKTVSLWSIVVEHTSASRTGTPQFLSPAWFPKQPRHTD